MGTRNIIFSSDDKLASLWSISNFTSDYYDQLKNIPLVEYPEINIMGRVCHQRRHVGFYSNESSGYRYSGQIAKAFPLDDAPVVKGILDSINDSLKTSFNGVLINKYTSGQDYISAHSDDEKGLDRGKKLVASLCYSSVDNRGNYNGIRKFRIREKESKKIVVDYQHQPGELLVMEGLFQKRYTHEIPIEKRVLGERISLTFRCHLISS